MWQSLSFAGKRASTGLISGLASTNTQKAFSRLCPPAFSNRHLSYPRRPRLDLKPPSPLRRIRAISDVSDTESKYTVSSNLGSFPRTGNFLGREEYLQRLWNSLQPNSTGRRVAVLHGDDGIGKSQLARQFADAHEHDFTAVFWIDGTSRESIIASLAGLADRLPKAPPVSPESTLDSVFLKQRASLVLDWLSLERNSRWLLVLDGFDDYSLSGEQQGWSFKRGKTGQQILPVADHGAIIITTESSELGSLGESYLVRGLIPDEAAMLLASSSSPPSIGEMPKSEIQETMLIERLEGNPLALTIASSYMRCTGVDSSSYLELHQQRCSQPTAPELDTEQPVTAALAVTYDEIQKLHPLSANLLFLLATYGAGPLWFELLSAAHDSSNAPDWYPDWYTEVFSSRSKFSETIQPLCYFSLVTPTGKAERYILHPVVRDFCSALSVKDREELNTLVLVSTSSAISKSLTEKSLDLQHRLLPHAAGVLQRLKSGWSPPYDLQTLHALDALGTFYIDRGTISDTERIYLQMLMGAQDSLGGWHPLTRTAVRQLRRLRLMRKNLGPSHWWVPILTSIVGVVEGVVLLVTGLVAGLFAMASLFYASVGVNMIIKLGMQDSVEDVREEGDGSPRGDD